MACVQRGAAGHRAGAAELEGSATSHSKRGVSGLRRGLQGRGEADLHGDNTRVEVHGGGG